MDCDGDDTGDIATAVSCLTWDTDTAATGHTFILQTGVAQLALHLHPVQAWFLDNDSIALSDWGGPSILAAELPLPVNIVRVLTGATKCFVWPFSQM